jgi:hypothetical protein
MCGQFKNHNNNKCYNTATEKALSPCMTPVTLNTKCNKILVNLFVVLLFIYKKLTTELVKDIFFSKASQTVNMNILCWRQGYPQIAVGNTILRREAFNIEERSIRQHKEVNKGSHLQDDRNKNVHREKISGDQSNSNDALRTCTVTAPNSPVTKSNWTLHFT